MNAQIRAADRASDALAIAQVHVSSWQTSYRGILPPGYLDGMSVPALAARWLRRIPSRRGQQSDPLGDLWVIERHGRVAGFSLIGACRDDTSLIGFAGEVLMLYVHPEHMGRGLGRALLEHSLDVLAQREFYWSVVWVLEKNRKARAFYGHMGLRADGASRWEHFSGQRVPVLRYAKAINPAIDFEALCHRPSSYHE